VKIDGLKYRIASFNFVGFITTKYTCISISRRTQNFKRGNKIVSLDFVVMVAEAVSFVGMDMLMEVVVIYRG
jgi:hypothetical protein